MLRIMKCKDFIVPLICFILFSCEGEIIDPLRVSKSVRLNAEIEGMKTRMTGSDWDEGDAIGVYMINSGVALDTSAPAQNVEYCYNDSSGEFAARHASDSLFFPFNEEYAVDFIGYYPYREEITDFIYPVDLTIQSNQAAIDLLYSNNACNRCMTQPEVLLTFSHQLSKVVFHIAHYRAIDLSGLSVIITDVPTESSFNLVDGSLSASAETKDIALGISEDGTTAEAILLPGTDLSESDFWFTLGDEQVYHIPSDSISIAPLTQSTCYTYHITLFTDEEALISSGEIDEWITGQSDSITADRTEDDPPAIKGSRSDPYTVAQAIINQGKEDVWVKGFIVGAFDGSISSFVTDTTGQVTTNVALADLSSEIETDNMLPVNITLTSLKNAISIAENPDNIGREVMIKGDLAAYYSVPALRSTTDYQFID
ncbi:MAG: fimbrillin family protein [Verrucomicrobiae bacterium]|nr:fimbrillin family protein [Verrucomicrobiae bacterium]